MEDVVNEPHQEFKENRGLGNREVRGHVATVWRLRCVGNIPKPAKASKARVEDTLGEVGDGGKVAKPRRSRMCPVRCWACDVEQTWSSDRLASETQPTLLVIIVKILMIIIITIY